MNKTNTKSEKLFIRQVILSSLLILLLAVLLGIVAARNPNGLRALCVRGLSAVGSYDSALNIVQDIDDEALRLENSYHLAQKMYENASFEPAAELFSQLGDYKDSRDKQLESSYAMACALYEAGDYRAARDGFALLSGYQDADRMQKQCLYAEAQAACQQGDYLSAVSLFVGLGSYEDAAERAYEAALEMTGNEDSARIIINSGGLSAEAVEKAAELARIRAALPLGRLAAGNRHTLYIRDDGSAAACGDNAEGQCNVEGWTELVQICAGAEHSAALRADGTVLAAGSNEHGQCEVSGWKNVVAIAAGDYDTLGLLSDGTVVSCGYHSYDSLINEEALSAVFAGSYGAAAVSRYGYLVSSGSSITAEKPQLLVELAIGSGFSAALYADSSLLCSALPEGRWDDIVNVDVSPRGIIAVDSEGHIRSCFFRESDKLDFGGLENVQLCAAGAGHYVFITADGALHAFGDNSYGQCNVSALNSAAAE